MARSSAAWASAAAPASRTPRSRGRDRGVPRRAGEARTAAGRSQGEALTEGLQGRESHESNRAVPADLRIDLDARPAPVGITRVSPAMLGVAVELEMIDLPGSRTRRQKCSGGPGGREPAWGTVSGASGPAGVWPGVCQPRLVGHPPPDLEPGLAQGPVVDLRPDQRHGSREPELLPGRVEVPAGFGPGRMLELDGFVAPAVGRESEVMRVAEETPKNDGTHRRTAVFPYGRKLDEPDAGDCRFRCRARSSEGRHNSLAMPPVWRKSTASNSRYFPTAPLRVPRA